MKNKKIFLAGHNGLVGSSILRKLKHLGFKKIILVNRKKLDLTNQKKVFDFLKKKNRILLLLLLQKLEEYWQIINTEQILFIKI